MQGAFCNIKTSEMVHSQFLMLTARQILQQMLMALLINDTATAGIKYFILLIGIWGFWVSKAQLYKI